MLDAAISYHRYQFLGHEFLTWLWFIIENPSMVSMEWDGGLSLGNRIVLENFRKDRRETITIKGDHSDLKEGMISLGKGAYVTEVHLRWSLGQQEWDFTLKGKSLHIGALKVPASGAADIPDEQDSFVLEKAFLCDKLIQLVNDFYNYFIRLRLSRDWLEQTVPGIRKWIQKGVHIKA